MSRSDVHSNSLTNSRKINRREVLTGAALALGALAVGKAESPATLPAVTIAGRTVSRLISGGNPLFGYSHFNGILDRHMR